MKKLGLILIYAVTYFAATLAVQKGFGHDDFGQSHLLKTFITAVIFGVVMMFVFSYMERKKKKEK